MNISELITISNAPAGSIRVYHTGAVAVPANTSTLVPFDTILWNIGFVYTVGSGIITLPSPGLYIMSAVILYQASAVGLRTCFCQIWPNGSQTNQGTQSTLDSTLGGVDISCDLLWYAANPGDTFQVRAFSVENQNLNIFGNAPHFTIMGPF